MEKSKPALEFRVATRSLRLFYGGIVVIDIALLATYLLARGGWAGIFATGSWQINEALKISNTIFFLMCFLETMKSLGLSASAEPSCAGMEYNRILAPS